MESIETLEIVYGEYKQNIVLISTLSALLIIMKSMWGDRNIDFLWVTGRTFVLIRLNYMFHQLFVIILVIMISILRVIILYILQYTVNYDLYIDISIKLWHENCIFQLHNTLTHASIQMSIYQCGRKVRSCINILFMLIKMKNK